MRELETSQPRRACVDIFGEGEHLKSAAEHFRMQQCLQCALGLTIASAVNRTVEPSSLGRLQRSGHVKGFQ